MSILLTILKFAPQVIQLIKLVRDLNDHCLDKNHVKNEVKRIVVEKKTAMHRWDKFDL